MVQMVIIVDDCINNTQTYWEKTDNGCDGTGPAQLPQREWVVVDGGATKCLSSMRHLPLLKWMPFRIGFPCESCRNFEQFSSLCIPHHNNGHASDSNCYAMWQMRHCFSNRIRVFFSSFWAAMSFLDTYIRTLPLRDAHSLEPTKALSVSAKVALPSPTQNDSLNIHF